MKVLFLIGAIIACLRILGINHIAYQALAHLFVGGLFGAYIVNKNKLLLYLFCFLTIVETICFLVFKFIGD